MTNKNDAKDLLNVINLVLGVGGLFLQEKEDNPEEPLHDQSDDSEMPHDTSYCDSVVNLLQEKVTSLKLRNQELDDKIIALEEENACLSSELEKQIYAEEVLTDAVKILADKVNRDCKLLASKKDVV